MGKGGRRSGGGAWEGEEKEEEKEEGWWGVGSNKTAEGKGRPAAAQRDTLQPPIGRQAGGDYGGGGCCRRSGGERMQEGSGELGKGVRVVRTVLALTVFNGFMLQRFN